MARRFIVTVIITLILLFFSGVFEESGVLQLPNPSVAAQVNTPPTLDLNGGETGENYNTFLVAGGAPVSIVSSGLTITDLDNTNLTSATIKITNPKDIGAENLALDLSGTGIGFSFNTGDEIGLIGTVPVTNYQQVLQTITYQNTSSTPDRTTRQISFVVNDGESNSNEPATSVQIVDPGVSISKVADTPIILKGDAANFSIEVENTGNVPLKNIIVTDETVTDCEVSITTLSPGDVYPISCSRPNVTADFTNLASVEAEDDLGNKVNASDTAEIQVIEPGISISKTPDNQTIASGASANFSIEIKNTGDVPLKNIIVSDQKSPDCADPVPTLTPGATHKISCSQPNVTADFTNQASVEAEDDLGNKVNASDTANVTVAKPGITINKKPDTQTILKGNAAEFSIEIKNNGNVPLNKIVVTDPNSPDCADPVPSLNPGQIHTISCAKANVTADFTNTAFVTAEHGYGEPISANDSATVKVVNPGISISKTADTPTVIKGDRAEFSIEVENIGDVALKNIIVSDPKAPGCGKTIPTLNPQQISSYSCSQNSVLTTFTNEASVRAEDNFGNTVTDKNSAVVKVIDPEISISKTADTPTIAKGGTAEFTIQIQNTGDVTLYNVQIKDDRAPDCRTQFSSPLAPGEKKTISCEKTNIESDFINIAEVVATEKDLNTIVTRTDDASVIVENPNISITKTPATQTIEKGGTAKFKIFVVNTSKFVDLVNVTVDDPKTPACSKKVAFDLDRGETEIYDCEIVGVTQPFTNEITVTGENSNNGQKVNDSSIALVKVRDMQVAMTIEPPVLTTPGEAVDFHVLVKNGGSIPLRLQSLTVDRLGSLTDPNNSNLGNNNCESAQNYEVDPGESFECSFSALSDQETGFYPYKLSVEAREEDNTLITGDASTSLTVVDSELLSVSLQANPGGVPAPGTTISEEIQIENPTQNSTFTLNILIHSEIGNLDNVGDCKLGNRIDPGETYTCTINIPVAGAAGDRVYHEVSAAGTTEDGKTTGNIGSTTILLFNSASLNNWLPVISKPVPPPENREEPNDVPCSAYPLIPGLNYDFFKLNDEEDWYEFDVRSGGEVTVKVENLVSRDAQVYVYKNDSCSQLKEADEVKYDGGFSTERELKFNADPGHYFIRITADDFSSGAVYKLMVLIP